MLRIFNALRAAHDLNDMFGYDRLNVWKKDLTLNSWSHFWNFSSLASAKYSAELGSPGW
jgi:hypothetical protein